MTKRLEGAKVLVTAAAQGIGRAIAERCAGEGAIVTATDINRDALAELSGMRTAYLDVREKGEIDELVSDCQPSVLINCAGFVHHGTILDCDNDDWAFSNDLNVTSTYRLCRAAIPAMVANGGGSIVNISSVASSIVGAPNRFVYGVTKAAIIGLTKSIAVDFASSGVRCNAICPGTIQTPSLDDRIAAQGDIDTARKAFVARQPMGRLGEAHEVASLAAYLASNEAAFTTGTVHIIDGGWTAG
ncbi:MAG: SDR family oxidoreductase [Pseudomonadota bacterium]